MRKSEVMNPGIISGLVRKVFAFMFLAFAVVSCGGDDEPDGGGDDEDRNPPVDYTEAISGEWLCLKADLIDAEGAIEETVVFNGYNYKACRFSITGDNKLKAQYLYYPSFEVSYTEYFTLDGDRILKEGILYGTITQYLEKGKYGSGPEIEIKWERVADPFNLGYTDRFQTSCYYMDASWAI